MKTYDIINAGPRNRFMANGRIVSNSGRGVQMQNLPQNHLYDLDLARQLVSENDLEMLEMLFGNVPDTLSQLIRTAFVAKPGCTFLVADFSAIEARVIAWVADEKWRLEVFATHGKIYEASGAQMFKVPIEEVTKGSELRQKAKVAELACIAEGQLVLTNKGLIPIDEITISHLVWDGVEFVGHAGLIYKGIKEVIYYEGLTATEDHLVWIDGQKGPVRFGYATTSGSHLLQSGNGRKGLRTCENNIPGKEIHEGLEAVVCADRVPQLSSCSVDLLQQPDPRKEQGLSNLLTTKTSPSVVGSKNNSGKTTLRESEGQELQELRSEGNSIQVSVNNGSRTLDNRNNGIAGQNFGDGQDRQQRELRERQYPIRGAEDKSSKQEIDGITGMDSRRLALCKVGSDPKTVIRVNEDSDNCGSGTGCIGETKELAGNRRKAKVYDILNAGPRNRFTVSGVLVHNCGYGGGVGALANMGAEKMGLKEEELQPIIDAWRAANPHIVKLWKTVENAAKEAVNESTVVTIQHGIKFEGHSNVLYIELPSGRKLSYLRPRMGKNKFGSDSLIYEGMNQTTKQWCDQETYGGKLVENCLSGETLVLTDNGWKLITAVTINDQLWDGVDWVEHCGLIEKGSRETIDIDGVRITPEHLVLTNKGWKHASQSKGYYRGEDTLPNSPELFRFGWKKIIMDISLRLRKRNSSGSNGISKEKTKVVRVSEIRSRFGEQNNARYVAPSRVLGLAINESQVHQSESQSLVELWGSWNFSLRRMACEFREFLGGYGAVIQKRVVNRSNRRKQGLLSEKLSVGVGQETSPKQTAQRFYRNPMGENNSCGSLRKIRNWGHYFALSLIKQLPLRRFVQNAGCYEPVYDILNAGVRSRFMVKGQNGRPFIVHNCIQAIARDCLAHSMLNLEKDGYEIVFHVHDECIIEKEEDKADIKEVCEIMGQSIPWAKGLPLRADGYETKYYKKD